MLKRLLSPAARPVGLPLPLTWTSVMGFGNTWKNEHVLTASRQSGSKETVSINRDFLVGGQTLVMLQRNPKQHEIVSKRAPTVLP